MCMQIVERITGEPKLNSPSYDISFIIMSYRLFSFLNIQSGPPVSMYDSDPVNYTTFVAIYNIRTFTARHWKIDRRAQIADASYGVTCRCRSMNESKFLSILYASLVSQHKIPVKLFIRLTWFNTFDGIFNWAKSWLTI